MQAWISFILSWFFTQETFNSTFKNTQHLRFTVMKLSSSTDSFNSSDKCQIFKATGLIRKVLIIHQPHVSLEHGHFWTSEQVTNTPLANKQINAVTQETVTHPPHKRILKPMNWKTLSNTEEGYFLIINMNHVWAFKPCHNK